MPKTVIEEAKLGRNLDITVERGAVVIRSRAQARQGWATDAQACRAAEADRFDDWDAAMLDGEWR
ncbi:MAG: hypothetical protein HY903_15635 [Deltaproteobacteria bacterium]|nr:hypothetical protein [Deltaproteobacteria bacterium]